MDALKMKPTEVKQEEKPGNPPLKRRRGMGHVCPPSNATHPKDRWDMYYVYMFIQRFTTLKDEIPGFLCIEEYATRHSSRVFHFWVRHFVADKQHSLENALLEEPGKVNYLLEQVVLRFILNLRPNTRNTSSELIPTTLYNVLNEFPRDRERLRERTVFWDWDADSNIMPLKDIEGGWWFASWDLKLRILRQLVDWQLAYSASVRDVIDTAWQVKQKPHKKKAEAPKPAPDAGTPGSREILEVKPLGQDKERTRFWVADGSPRLYTSTNPWKITQIFKCVSTRLEEYIEWIDKLRQDAPPEPEENMAADQKHQMHWDLIYALEARVDLVDDEIRRMARVRKMLDSEAEARAAADANRRLHFRRTAAESDSDREMAVSVSVKSEHTKGSKTLKSIEHELDDRHISPFEAKPSIFDDDANDKDHFPEDDNEGDDDAEIDELQDDSSLNPQSDDEKPPTKGRKRRRRYTSPLSKRDRGSARKRRRREELEKVEKVTKIEKIAANGSSKINGTNAAASTPPREDQPLSGPPVVAPTLKGSKGQNTKFWFYDEDDGIPKKKPKMLDDPDALLRRRRKQHKANQSIDSAQQVDFKNE